MRLIALLLGLLLPAWSQITDDGVGHITAIAADHQCVMSQPDLNHVTVACSFKGEPYGSFTWPLDPGSDRSGYLVMDGNTINFSASRVNNTVTWFLSVQPNGGPVTRQNGTFPPWVGAQLLNPSISIGPAVCDISGEIFTVTVSDPTGVVAETLSTPSGGLPCLM